MNHRLVIGIVSSRKTVSSHDEYLTALISHIMDVSKDKDPPEWSTDRSGSRIFIHGAAGVAHQMAHRASDEVQRPS
jgi:hypothetical protein